VPVYLQSFAQRLESLYSAHLAWRSADLNGALNVLSGWAKSIGKESRRAAEDHIRRLIKMQRAPTVSSTGALENVSMDRSLREVLIPARVHASSLRMQRGSWPSDTFG
jgi:hypothetical protein